MGKIPEKSWGFSPPTSDSITVPWPVKIRGLGHEIRSSRDYRWNTARHGNSGWVIQYTLSGQGSFSWSWPQKPELPGGQVTVGPGQAFITAPGMDYEYTWLRPQAWDFAWIMVDGPWAGEVLASLASLSPVFTLARDSLPILRLLALLESLGQGIPPDRRTLSQEAYGLLLALEAALTYHESADPTADQARSWIKRHWQDASGTSLAGHFGYHPKYFISWFKARTGLTPERFIQTERIRQAAIRLESTPASIATIAVDLGFEDAKYFSRLFKASRGLSPASWRRHHGASRFYDEVIGGD